MVIEAIGWAHQKDGEAKNIVSVLADKEDGTITLAGKGTSKDLDVAGAEKLIALLQDAVRFVQKQS
jgi:hypothetical protein